MKKNKSYIITLSLLFALLFNTCKKYPEGGFAYLTRKHLFGGHKAGDSKTWKLVLYEVNGIDSTAIIPGANNVPNYYDEFITLILTNPKERDFKASNYFYEYSGSVVEGEGIIFSVAQQKTKQDSIQCYLVGGAQICCRNIILPEGPWKNNHWTVERLTSSDIWIKLNLTKNYRIKLKAK